VLEHVPRDKLTDLCAAIRDRLQPNGFSIHAIDHVYRGAGDEEHLAKLRAVVRAHGISEAELTTLLERLDQDPDAYFLSAEAHNRWRGSTPYEEFPMRRCVSIHLCVQVNGMGPHSQLVRR
jgi:hypothetical protein